MTRFARAQGSKSSNVRTPEDSTPWEVMQEQILKSKRESEETKKREEAEKQRIENYNKFLKDRKTEKRKAAWCEFPETSFDKKPKFISLQPEGKLKKKQKINKIEIDSDKEINTENSNHTSETNWVSKKKQKKNKGKVAASSEQSNTDIIETSAIENSIAVSKQQQKKNLLVTAEIQQDSSNSISEKSKKKKKDKKFHDKPEKEENITINNNSTNENEQVNKAYKNKDKRQKKLNSIPTRRKAVDDSSFELIINGKNIELVRYDGFPIMKKDAEKLEELKQNMIKKGIPKSEVQRTMKLERRRAEKALARVKREVCYNCRKGGHNLSDCPDLKSRLPGRDVAEGICFKCGSTEHRQFECKVQRDKEFRFATCFVCKEPGHIARQCPDNPKGLYPNGGCCKLCGDVTHLRKDCPTVTDKKEETSIKLQTLSSNDLEDIDQPVNKTTEEKQRKPKKIKF